MSNGPNGVRGEGRGAGLVPGDAAGWVVDPGDYEIVVAASAADVRARLPLRITR